MAIDPKYGRVTLEHGTIEEDEIVIVFRARDALLPKVLAYYHLFCTGEGAPRRHLDLIMNGRQKVLDWQRANPFKVRTPDSEASRAWLRDNEHG